MAGLKNIKLKIQSVQKTRKVTRAMEAVSAVKMRKSQERALIARPYAMTALAVLARISGSEELAKHPLGHTRPGKTALVVIASDKGLAGALNSSVLKACEKAIRERSLRKEEVVVLAIGKRAAEYFHNRGFDVRLREENVADGVSEGELARVSALLLELHDTGEIGSALVVYTNFISTFEQKAVARSIMPLTTEFVGEMVRGIVPPKGRYAHIRNIESITAPAAYTVEPSSHEVLAVLVPKLLTVAVYHALLEAKASEHSARMVAMKNATDKAKEVAKDLTLAFNKARQAAITREVSEITSGIEAMR